MTKQFLDKLGLEELMKLIIELDSEGDAIELTKNNHHKIISVKFDGETIKLNSEGELTLPLDYETIFLSSEGLLKARPEALESGIATEVYYNSEGKEVVDVKLDGKTIILDSEGQLQTQVGGWIEKGGLVTTTLATMAAEPPIDSAGTIFVYHNVDASKVSGSLGFEAEFNAMITSHTYNKTATFTRLFPRNAFEFVDAADHLTWTLDADNNELVAECTAGVMPVAPYISGTLSAKVEGDIIHHIDSKFINVDGATIIIDSEGKLEATFQKPSADLPIEVDADGKISLRYDEETLVLNSEGILNVPIDDKTIVIDSEGHIVVNIDNDTIILDSEGRLSSGSVYPDEITIVKDANKIISVPIDYDTIVIASDGSGHVISPRGKINGVELKGDHNTEEAKITWWGTVDEYNILKNAGLLNEYTLYVINNSEGYIPASPNYNSLINKPQINHVELSGDKTLNELGIQSTISNGTAIDFNNNTVSLRYHAGVLSVNTSNELFANTYTVDQINNMIGSMRTIKVVSVMPVDPAVNTLYYVETTDPNIYDVILVDSYKTQIPLGTSQVGTYSAGTAIDIDTFNVISVQRDLSVTDAGTDGKVPTTKAVYDFLLQPASDTADGERGLVPQPVAGDEHKLLAGNATWVNSFGAASATGNGYCGPVPAPAVGDEKSLLRGDATWAKIVNDCITDVDDQPLSAAQGKYLEDRLGTDADWAIIPTNAYVQSGTIYRKKKNNVIMIRLADVKLTSPLNLEIGTVPTEIKPNVPLTTTVIALNNNNAQAAFTVDAAGTMKLYSKTGQYAYSGTLVYIN